MKDQAEVIKQFYTAFSERRIEKMLECYHEGIVFEDPAFGVLRGDQARWMWRMLLSNNSAELKVDFGDIEADEEKGSAKWVATYLFGPKKRKVVNRVSASFKFEDGKIIEHKDTFDLWRWTRQALGLPGYLLGWSPFMKGKIQKMTNSRLNAFIEQESR